MYADSEYNARLAALMEMLRARGTEPSESVHKLFSTDISPQKGILKRTEPPRTPPELAPSEVQKLREENDRLRLLATPPRTAMQRDLFSGSPGSDKEAADGALVKAINVQTEAIQAALKSKETKHSVVKITPTFKWPVLGDDGPDAKEVEEF